MMNFLIYEGKVAVMLLVFYLFYRFLLKKETFHRFNRWALVGTVVMSFVLPLCVITIHKQVEMETVVLEPEIIASMDVPAIVESSEPWWPTALAILFWAGVAFVLVRVALSIASIIRIIRESDLVQEGDGCKVVATNSDVEPFSWMRYIVLSKTDLEGNHSSILVHEKAHVKSGHSIELLLVDILSSFQWFNPAIWMLRSDLQELHEYEADDFVLRNGIDIKEYQYLLLRKAVSKSGYSIANSFNHSILKNRFTMMSKSKSPQSRGLKALYVLPLVCLCIGLQAKTVNEPVDKVNENSDNITTIASKSESSPLYILRQVWGEEREITKAEFDEIEQHRIKSIEVLKNTVAKEKYGDKAANGVIVITMRLPQELDEIVVISYDDKDEAAPFYLVEPETMPTFQGEGMNAFSRWLNMRIARPKGCKHVGKMKVSFVVDDKGVVGDVKVMESVCEELDNLVVSLIEQSPKWEPATANGEPVSQCLTIPITFQMR